MKRKSIIAAFSAFLIAAGFSAQSYDVKTEIRKPTFIYGIGLSEKDVERTAELLGIENIDGINVSSISGAELDRILNGGSGYTKDSEMISSVAVVQEKPGSGIEVAIATPDYITLVSELQYENACLTAGIKDVYVAVGAVSEVTGESALAGISKAFEINSETLDTRRMETAEKEMNVTSQIIKNNTVINEKTSEFNMLILEIKQYIIENASISEEELKKYIETRLKENYPDLEFTAEEKEELTSLFSEFQKITSEDKDIKEQADILKEKREERNKETESNTSSNTSNTSNTVLPTEKSVRKISSDKTETEYKESETTTELRMINGDKEIKESTETSEKAEGERIPTEDDDSPELIAIKKEIILSDKTFEESKSFKYVFGEYNGESYPSFIDYLYFKGDSIYENIGPKAGTFIPETENSGIWTGMQGGPDSRFYFTKYGLLRINEKGNYSYYRRMED